MKQIKNLILKFPQIYLYYKKLTYILLAFSSRTKEKNIFQEASTTEFNRHPDIFNFLKVKYKNENIKILSFGCSSGEECMSLNKYLPNASILGIDINKKSLAKAKQNNRNQNISYKYCEPNKISELGEFDVVIAISVLCKHPEATYLNELTKFYPFERYEEMVNKLDSIVKVDGLLIIRSSNYIFSDVKISNKYEFIENSNSRKPMSFPKFNSKGFRKKDYIENKEIFKKKNLKLN